MRDGTGQATLPLAATGCRIIAVELGANLAAVCRRNLAGFPQVQVVTAGFETWPLPGDPFDVVTAATAWHWLDPTVRVTRTARALRSGGTLAVIETHHVVAGGDGNGFLHPGAGVLRTPRSHHHTWASAAYRRPGHAAGGHRDEWLVRPATFGRYPWHTTYPTGAYLDLLMTYSGHRALPVPARTRLLDCIANLIDTRHGGRVVKHYLTQLWVARRTTNG